MRPFHHATCRLLAAAFLSTLLLACQGISSGPGPASASRAERLLRQGNEVEAARMYEELAANNPSPARDEFAMAAARAWLDANRADDAQRALNLSTEQLPAAQLFERSLLRVEVGAARGQYQAAWREAQQIEEPAQPQNAARLFHLRQQVALRAGQPSDAVRAGMARERVAADEGGRNRARRDLLNDLRGAIDRGLRVDPRASRDALERGWLEIAQIASSAGRSPLSATTMIEGWRQRFPGHPASTIVASEILDPAARPDGSGARLAQITGPVALLLPLSAPGRNNAAALIRDGFRAGAAQLSDAGLADVRLYDTGSMSVATAVRQAVAEGASFIVGPLTKEEAQSAVEEQPAHVPMLLLNTLPGPGGSGSWQFGLAPEDEARQIARHLAGSGRRNVVMFTPVGVAGDWGPRVASAFSEALVEGGGRVVAEGRYDYSGSRNNIEATLTAALGIGASQARRDRVQQLTRGRVEFDPQPSPDIDAVFVAGWDPAALRQFRPFLRHYGAEAIPAYMTSDGVDAERMANRDLEGMRLLEMPWVLDTVGAARDVRLATQGSWSSRGTPQETRLFAFGYDAAMLAAAFRRGAVSWPVDGLTGRLSLAADGRIERQLQWARVRNGDIEAADPLAP